MYRLLAIDLDDTLLTAEKTVTQRSIDMLQRAVASGMTVVIATGRVPYMLPPIVSQLPLNGPKITGNGAIILDSQTDNPLSEHLISVENTILVLEELRRLELSYSYYAHERMYVEPALFESYGKHVWGKHPKVQRNDDAELHLKPCIKIAAYGEIIGMREKRQELELRLAGKLYVTQTALNCLEILHPAVSKANALKSIIDELGIKAEEVIACGDNHNDIEMLQLAGLGVAMENAEMEVKAVADYITLSNNEDGVASAIEKFVFSQNV